MHEMMVLTPPLFVPEAAVSTVYAARVQKMLNCSFSSFSSYSVDPISSSFPAESLNLENGLEWCTAELTLSHLPSATFS